jgi:hypothetical protein
MVLDDLILKEIRVSFLLFCLKKDAGDFSPTSKSIEPKFTKYWKKETARS